jgi:hypothetical protein
MRKRNRSIWRTGTRHSELEDILDGPPPELPRSTAPPEHQKLDGDTAWAETGLFTRAVMDLRDLLAKPVKRFVGKFAPAELREVADFLLAIASASDRAEARCEAEKRQPPAQTGDDLGIPTFLDRRLDGAKLAG